MKPAEEQLAHITSSVDTSLPEGALLALLAFLGFIIGPYTMPSKSFGCSRPNGYDMFMR